MKSHRFLQARELVAVVLLAGSAACSGQDVPGGTPGGTAPTSSGAFSPPDQSGCAETASDVTLSDTGEATSPVPSYGHPGCPDSFVVGLPGRRDPRYDYQSIGVTLDEDVSTLDEAQCSSLWLRASLWRKQNEVYVQISTRTYVGQMLTGPFSHHTFCSVVGIDFDSGLAGGGDFKIVTSAGMRLSSQKRVRVSYQDFFGAYCVPESEFGQPCEVETNMGCTSGATIPPTMGIKGCHKNEEQIGCVYDPNVIPRVCHFCGHDCGGCAEAACTSDAECAPGLACNVTRGQCEALPGCQPPDGFCWFPSSTWNFGVERRATCP